MPEGALVVEAVEVISEAEAVEGRKGFLSSSGLVLFYSHFPHTGEN